MAEPSLISTTTVVSLASTVALLGAAYGASLALLPKNATTKTRIIYIWHLFDALTHFVLEGSFLYHSLFSSSAIPSTTVPTLYGDHARSYGAVHSTSPLALLWQEYARADERWGVSDVGVVSIELITVLLGGPLALWITEQIRRGEGRQWYWITVLAVAELYGGWMTFAPEWVSGNENLVTDVGMYKWVYLAFFNGLWVVIPGWLLCEAYWHMVPATEERMRRVVKGGKRN